jgi:hypothetical protein
LLQNGVKVLAVTGLAALSFALLVYQPEQGIKHNSRKIKQERKKNTEKSSFKLQFKLPEEERQIFKRKRGKPIFLINPVNLAEDPGQKLARTHLEITVKFF